MSVIAFTDELTSPVPAKRMFNAFVFDINNLFPKVLPQYIKNIEVIAGDGGPGSIKKLNFAEGVELKHLKHRVDAVDKEKLTYNYTLIEGESLMENLESISYEIKFEASPEGGSKVTTVTKYYPKLGAEINKDKIKEDREKLKGMYKAVEGHLFANPTVCA